MGGGGKRSSASNLFATMLLHLVIHFDMQNDHVLKKLNFDLMTLSPGSDVSASKILATMLLHS